jgi:hypothetical protein
MEHQEQKEPERESPTEPLRQAKEYGSTALEDFEGMYEGRKTFDGVEKEVPKGVPQLSLIPALMDLGFGAEDIADGKYVEGGVRTAKGGNTAVQAVASAAEGGEAVKKVTGPLGTVLDLASAGDKMAHGDYAGGALDGTSALFSMLNPLFGTAFKAGNAGGNWLTRGADDYADRHGYRHPSELGIAAGHTVRDAIPIPGVSDVAGALTDVTVGTVATLYDDFGEAGDGLIGGAEAAGGAAWSGAKSVAGELIHPTPRPQMTVGDYDGASEDVEARSTAESREETAAVEQMKSGHWDEGVRALDEQSRALVKSVTCPQALHPTEPDHPAQPYAH